MVDFWFQFKEFVNNLRRLNLYFAFVTVLNVDILRILFLIINEICAWRNVVFHDFDSVIYVPKIMKRALNYNVVFHDLIKLMIQWRILNLSISQMLICVWSTKYKLINC